MSIQWQLFLLIQKPLQQYQLIAIQLPFPVYLTMNFDQTKKTINDYAYFISQRIGNGCSSEVFRGINEKTKENVAIKVVNKGQKKVGNKEMANAQVKFLQDLQQRSNILQIKNTIQTKNNIYIITELCEKGCLADALKEQRKFPQERAIRNIEQIINGFKSIAQNNIVHRDLKLVNIFITGDNELKIGDFGFAVEASSCEKPQIENVGSPLYMAPQALTQNIYSIKSDIWAIGIIFLEMLIGKNPWKSRTETQLANQVMLSKIESLIPLKIGNKSKQFLIKCLQKDRELRMNLNELKQFSFKQEGNSSINSIPSDIKLKNILNSNNPQVKSNTNFTKFSSEIVQNTSNCSLEGGQNCNIKSQINLLKIPKSQHANSNTERYFPNSFVKKQKNSSFTVKTNSNQIKINPKKSTQQKINTNQKSFNCSIKVLKGEQLNKNEKTNIISQDNNFDSGEVKKKEIVTFQKLSLPETTKNAKPVKTDSNIINRHKVGDSIQKISSQLKKVVQRQNVMSTSQLHESKKDQNQQSGKQSLCVNNSSTNHVINRKITIVQRQILLQAQSQINYFRFIYKLMKKLFDILKTTDEKIIFFEGSLFSLIHTKIDDIQELKNIKQITKIQLKEFQKTYQYRNLLDVLKKYKERYGKQNQKDKIELRSESEKEFVKLMIYVMKIIYQNIVRLQEKKEDLNRKKGLVFILQDLIELTKLYFLDKEQNWHNFYQKSNINKIIEKVPPQSVNSDYWLQVKKRFIDLGYS